MILALDIGTSSTRSAIYDAKGNRAMATTAQFTYPLQTGPDGKAELRPGDIDQAVKHAFAGTLKSWRDLKSSETIAAIGVSCFWHRPKHGAGRPGWNRCFGIKSFDRDHRPQNRVRKTRGAETVIDIDHRNIGRARVQHAQQRSDARRCCARLPQALVGNVANDAG